MHALALRAEQAEQFDGPGPGGAEPVRNPGVELGRLAGVSTTSCSASTSRSLPSSTYSHSYPSWLRGSGTRLLLPAGMTSL